MPVIACPTDIVAAPVDLTWSLLDPSHLDEWWDARVVRVTPEGPLSAGQRIEAGAGPMSRLKVTMDVLSVDSDIHRARMHIVLPFGVVNDETMTMVPLGADRCRVSFG